MIERKPAVTSWFLTGRLLLLLINWCLRWVSNIVYSLGLIPPCHRFDTSVAGAGVTFDATTWALNRFDSS